MSAQEDGAGLVERVARSIAQHECSGPAPCCDGCICMSQARAALAEVADYIRPAMDHCTCRDCCVLRARSDDLRALAAPATKETTDDGR